MGYAAAQINFFEEPDDYVLENNPNVTYVKVLNKIDYELFKDEATLYYKSLAKFNKKQAKKSKKLRHQQKQSGTPLNKDEVYQELLFEILETNSIERTVLFKLPTHDEINIDEINSNPMGAGRKAKDFLSLVKAFLGVSYMGLKNSPTNVYSQLINNPSFARKCGFKYLISENTKLSQENIPSPRKIEQFDQIMNLYGIWSKMKWKMVIQNLTDGTVEIEKDISFDTSHVKGNSSFTTAETVDKKGEKTKRSIGKLSKRCSCIDKNNCNHKWEVTDRGCGVIFKSLRKIFWAHKASFVCFPKSQIPIDAVALNKASTNDGETIIPHIKRLKEHIGFILKKIKSVMADGPYNTKENKDYIQNELKAIPYVPINSRNIKIPSAVNIKGIDHFTKNGVPICNARLPLEMKGRDLNKQRYIWGPPILEEKNQTVIACSRCILKNDCCPKGQGRSLRTKASDFPQIDWKNPQHSIRWKKQYNKRTAIERAIKTIKVDYCAEDFNKRDSVNFQGHLDKTMLALHILLSSS